MSAPAGSDAVGPTAARSAGLATVIGSWESEGVRLGDVEAALSGLRRHEERAVVRTSVLTLVAVVEDDLAAEDVLAVVRGMGGRHPSRTLVLVVPDDEDGGQPAANGVSSGIDAAVRVEMVDGGADAPAVCFESLVLRTRGRVRYHLDSVVRPFSLPDLPVVLWAARRLPSLGDPLLDVADRLVVDTRGRTGPLRPALAAVGALARRLPIADLSWSRLAAWRQLLGSLFEGPEGRGFLEGTQRVEVSGRDGPRHLLGGWLMDRLGLGAGTLHLEEAEHVALRVFARSRRDGRAGSFAVERPGQERVLRATVKIEGRLSLEQAVRLGDNWPGRALADLLTRPPLDTTYARALAGAMALAAVTDEEEAAAP